MGRVRSMAMAIEEEAIGYVSGTLYQLAEEKGPQQGARTKKFRRRGDLHQTPKVWL